MEIRPIFSALLRNKTAPLLIAAQVALTLAIICNALYLIRDRLSTAARATGADEQNLFEIRLTPFRTITDKKDMQRLDLQTLLAIPGVRSAARTNQIPLGQSGWNTGGLTADPKRPTSIGAAQYMSAESLIDTFGLRLVEGRDFRPDEIIDNNPNEERARPGHVIITRALAELLFPGEAQVAGKRIYMGGPADSEPPVQIVGVVEKLQSPSAPTDAVAENSMILPIRFLVSDATYSVRTEPGQRDRVMREAEKALLALRTDRVLDKNRSFVEVRATRYAREKMMAGLLIAVTGFLLLITASGIVGMASLWVNQRRKQIGVRRALGARRVDILRYFLIENLLISSTGILAGLVMALLLNDLLVRELSVPRLPLAYLGVGMVAMWLLGLLAVLGPAQRAAAVSPAIATRTA